ncbi:hypothetical protein QUB56_09155 [Microcoleus sp. AR_TQ3_B6]|uniref:hypothetical protein n=1 Tax=Microcoleus sp. AR_TQ3_B6 TaxID=3055284 RepID=UPI002FD3F37B
MAKIERIKKYRYSEEVAAHRPQLIVAIDRDSIAVRMVWLRLGKLLARRRKTSRLNWRLKDSVC